MNAKRPEKTNNSSFLFGSPQSVEAKSTISLGKLDYGDALKRASSPSRSIILDEKPSSKMKSKTGPLTNLDFLGANHKRFWIAEKLEGLKQASSACPYIKQKTQRLIDDLSAFTRPLDSRGSMHDFFKYLGKGNANQPCQSKCSGLSTVSVGDFDLEELDIDHARLQSVVMKRLQHHERSYLALKSSINKRQPCQAVRRSNVFQAFKDNDKFFSSRQRLADLQAIGGQINSILQNHDKDRNCQKKRMVSMWRQAKESSELSLCDKEFTSKSHLRQQTFVIKQSPSHQRKFKSFG